jgi:hypothetical protein
MINVPFCNYMFDAAMSSSCSSFIYSLIPVNGKGYYYSMTIPIVYVSTDTAEVLYLYCLLFCYFCHCVALRIIYINIAVLNNLPNKNFFIVNCCCSLLSCHFTWTRLA